VHITLIALFLMISGLGLCWFGYSRWKGKIHWSYLDHGFFQEVNYLAIPIGVASLILGVAVLPVIPAPLQLTLIFLAGFVMILGFMFSWRLFKPEWVKWIEKNYEEVIPYLMIELRDHGWQVETRDELEEWVKDLNKKYNISVETESS
jgi:TRAP-type C4-dicarboxylate transport system permease small subunit